MRALPLLALACLLPACLTGKEPEDGLQPEIRLLYPTDTSPLRSTGSGESCALDLLVVVDILNLNFVPPSQSNGAVEGEGHYHLQVDDLTLDRPEALWAEQSLVGARYCAGNILTVRVFLADGAHLDLDQFAAWEAVAEPEIVADTGA